MIPVLLLVACLAPARINPARLECGNFFAYGSTPPDGRGDPTVRTGPTGPHPVRLCGWGLGQGTTVVVQPGSPAHRLLWRPGQPPIVVLMPPEMARRCQECCGAR